MVFCSDYFSYICNDKNQGLGRNRFELVFKLK